MNSRRGWGAGLLIGNRSNRLTTRLCRRQEKSPRRSFSSFLSTRRFLGNFFSQRNILRIFRRRLVGWESGREAVAKGGRTRVYCLSRLLVYFQILQKFLILLRVENFLLKEFHWGRREEEMSQSEGWIFIIFKDFQLKSLLNFGCNWLVAIIWFSFWKNVKIGSTTVAFCPPNAKCKVEKCSSSSLLELFTWGCYETILMANLSDFFCRLFVVRAENVAMGLLNSAILL